MKTKITLATCFLLTQTGCPDRAVRPAPSDSATAAQASASVSATPVDSAPKAIAERNLDGCWGDSLPPSAKARVDTILKRCAQGMKARGETREIAVAESGVDVDLGSVKAGTCVRVAAATQGGVDLHLLDSKGKDLASDYDAAFSLVPLKGPICLNADGALRAKLSKITQPGTVALQIVFSE